MIDPRAVVDPAAEIAADVSIGAFTIIGPHVRIDSGTKVGPHVVINGRTHIGKDNQIYQFCSLGEIPQDKKYAGEPTRLEIGDRNTIREYCSFNRGTQQGGGVTQVGDDNWIMAYVHIAHDCRIGNDTIFANCASLAGHVEIGDYAILGGFSIVHQFCHVGAHSLLAMGAGINRDVPPYVIASGHLAKAYGINTEGLKRRSFTPEAIRAVRQAYKVLYRSHLRTEQALVRIQEMAATTPELTCMVEFLQRANRGIIR